MQIKDLRQHKTVLKGLNFYNPRLQPGDNDTTTTVAPKGRNKTKKVTPLQGYSIVGDRSPRLKPEVIEISPFQGGFRDIFT